MILTCGEALIDMIPTTVDGNEAFRPLAGGAVFNTAIALGRLRIDSGLLTGLSSDMFGDILRTTLEESNVAIDHAVVSDRPTTLAFVKLSNGQAKYAFFDENTAGRMLEVADMPKSLPADIKVMFFGGISLACEPSADAYVDLMQRESADRLIMVDPNIRPSFIADEGRYRARLNKIIANTDIMKISDDDLDWVDPSSSSHAEKSMALISKGIKLVALTRGSKDAQLYSADGLIAEAKTPKAEVIDTVGAGDAFNAGFLSRLYKDHSITKDKLKDLSAKDLKGALTFATHFASETVKRAGANPPWDFEL